MFGVVFRPCSGHDYFEKDGITMSFPHYIGLNCHSKVPVIFVCDKFGLSIDFAALFLKCSCYVPMFRSCCWNGWHNLICIRVLAIAVPISEVFFYGVAPSAKRTASTKDSREGTFATPRTCKPSSTALDAVVSPRQMTGISGAWSFQICAQRSEFRQPSSTPSEI